jgi:hypothetical protein
MFQRFFYIFNLIPIVLLSNSADFTGDVNYYKTQGNFFLKFLLAEKVRNFKLNFGLFTYLDFLV